MVFTLQFQQFSAARGQWLTDVLVVKDLKFWVLVSYIPRIIAWISPHQHISRRGIVQRVVWTQGTVIDDKPAEIYCPVRKCGGILSKNTNPQEFCDGMIEDFVICSNGHTFVEYNPVVKDFKGE